MVPIFCDALFTLTLPPLSYVYHSICAPMVLHRVLRSSISLSYFPSKQGSDTRFCTARDVHEPNGFSLRIFFGHHPTYVRKTSRSSHTQIRLLTTMRNNLAQTVTHARAHFTPSSYKSNISLQELSTRVDLCREVSKLLSSQFLCQAARSIHRRASAVLAWKDGSPHLPLINGNYGVFAFFTFKMTSGWKWLFGRKVVLKLHLPVGEGRP